MLGRGGNRENDRVKYKIAIIPYLVVEDNEIITTNNKYEALEHAQFISSCFNKE